MCDRPCPWLVLQDFGFPLEPLSSGLSAPGPSSGYMDAAGGQGSISASALELRSETTSSVASPPPPSVPGPGSPPPERSSGPGPPHPRRPLPSVPDTQWGPRAPTPGPSLSCSRTHALGWAPDITEDSRPLGGWGWGLGTADCATRARPRRQAVRSSGSLGQATGPPPSPRPRVGSASLPGAGGRVLPPAAPASVSLCGLGKEGVHPLQLHDSTRAAPSLLLTRPPASPLAGS